MTIDVALRFLKIVYVREGRNRKDTSKISARNEIIRIENTIASS